MRRVASTKTTGVPLARYQHSGGRPLPIGREDAGRGAVPVIAAPWSWQSEGGLGSGVSGGIFVPSLGDDEARAVNRRA